MSSLHDQSGALSSKKLELLAARLRQRGIGVANTSSAIPRREGTGPCPLSFAQQRLWFLDQLEPGSSAYIIPIAVRFYGALQTSALMRSLDEVVRRHEILRTTFQQVDSQPVQVVAPHWTNAPVVVDLSALPFEPRITEARHLAQQEGNCSFDLAQGPLWRARLLRLHVDDHVFLLTMHHIISDAWSSGVLVREVNTLYNAFCQEQPASLPALSIQYADFAVWQRQWLQGEVLEKQIRYWTERLRGVSPLELPTDYPRPVRQTFRGAYYGRQLPERLSREVQSFSGREGVTLFMLLLAAFQVLLFRYTSQEDIAVGTPIANRNRTEIEALIGFFVNTLVLRTQLSGDLTFAQLLARVKEETLAAYAHQDVPFEKVVEVLQPERDLSRPPLFQVMFNLQDISHTAESLAGLVVEDFTGENASTKFDLTLAVTVTPTVLHCSLGYNRDLFSQTTVARLLTHWEQLLASIVTHPEQRLSELELLRTDEYAQQMISWNETRKPWSDLRSLHVLFEDQAMQRPDQIAVICGTERLTYRQLNEQANQLAYLLRREGIGSDRLVGLCMERSAQMIMALLAVLKAGGAYVPVDPALPPERLAYLLQDAETSVVLTQEALLPQLHLLKRRILCLEHIAVLLVQESTTNLSSSSTLSDLAYIIYTSGSTGLPKGVMISHRSVSNYVYSLCDTLHIQHGWHFATVSTLAADLGNTSVFCSLASGGILHVLLYETVLSGEAFAHYTVQAPLDVLKIVPSHLQALLTSTDRPTFLPSRFLILGGEAFPETLLTSVHNAGCSCSVINHYGPTEATIGALVNVLGEVRADTAMSTHVAGRGGSLPIGRPLANTEAYILDHFQRIVPIGVVGELYLGGAGVAQGYLHQPGLTAERFIPHPFSTTSGARLYRTGDLTRYRADGSIEFVGRGDGQVKIRGYRVEPGEVEAVLRQLAPLKDCIVIAREDVPGEKRLVAYVVMHEFANPSYEILYTYLQEKLPDYMLPSAIVTLDALPLTTNGKVDRRALPLPGTQHGRQIVSSPRAHSPIEELICDIWRAILRIESPGVHDNFFTLGGHSLLATRVIARVRSVLQVDVPLHSFFEFPTVAGLAQRVEQALREKHQLSRPALVPVSRDQDLPLSFAQQRLWFLEQLQPGSTAYNVPIAVRLSGELNISALQESFQLLLRRHEALRTVFREKDGVPVQIVTAVTSCSLPLMDLSSLPFEQRRATERRLIEDEAHRVFDLVHGPLLRLALVRQDKDEHVLLLTLHHIVSDARSREVLVRDITELYQACLIVRPYVLPDLCIQYADYAVWQRSWLQGAVLEQQIAYWTTQLQDITPLALPTDYLRPAVQTFRGAHQAQLLPASLRDALTALSQREGVTLFMTLLAAFQIILARYSGQWDIAVGTPVAHRTYTETEDLIGFFVNTLVLRTDFSDNPTFLELLARVRTICLHAYTRQDVPFEKLVEALQPERDLSRSPLFQAMINFQQAMEQDGAPELEGLSSEMIIEDSLSTKFDITLVLTDTTQGLLCEIEYATDLFSVSTITRFLRHWQNLLMNIVAAPATRVAALPFIDEQELHILLHTWNATQAPLPVEVTMQQLFVSQALRVPDRVALVFQDMHLTYAELYARVGHLACVLQAQGVGPDVLVGIYQERSIEMVISLLGVMVAGGAYVPLDPVVPEERIAAIIVEAQLSLILSNPQMAGRLPASTPRLHFSELLSTILSTADNCMSYAVEGSNLAYVLYTSGSTGKPKGVMVTHAGLMNYVHWSRLYYQIEAGNGSIVHSSIAFDLTITSLLVPLTAGQCVCLAPEGPGVESLRQLLWQRGDLSLIKITPAHLKLFNQAIDGEEMAGLVRTCVIGGEALLEEHVAPWLRQAPATRLINEYGPTETVVGCCIHDVLSTDNSAERMPIGRPIANTQLYVLDVFLQPVPVGVTGELYIGGIGVARGYLHRPDLTAERFIADPFGATPGARLYKTGDLVRYRSDGELEFLGRNDHQVKVRGYRIELGEIDAALHQHLAVKECLVIVREDRVGDRQLVAYIVAHQGEELDERQVRQFLRAKLPGYMLPSRCVFLAELPLTANGKVNRQVLPQPDYRAVMDFGENGHVRGGIEEVVAQIYAQVLGRERVSAHDDFFELGGHSLLATQAIARIRVALKVEIPLISLFTTPTVAGLTERIELLLWQTQGIAAPPPLQPVSRTKPLLLSFAQQRLWFLDQLDPANAAYNIANTVRLYGVLSVEMMERSFQEVVFRHESLRTLFHISDQHPLQVIIEDMSFSLPIIDLHGIMAETREQIAQQLVKQENLLPFDLTCGPLIRVKIMRVAPQEHLLLVTLHHIISDGWSMGVLVREVTLLYNAFTAGRPSPLSPLPIQFADFAVWQRQWLQGEVLEAQLGYWHQKLAGVVPLELLTDHPRPLEPSFSGDRSIFHVPLDLAVALRELSRRESVTLFITLLTAFKILLYRSSGQLDIVVGTDIANRTRVETEELIGFFINLLPLRTDLSGSPSFRELLGRVRETVLGAYAHQDTPFEMLVERLQLQDGHDHTPLVRALFVLQNMPVPDIDLAGLTLSGVETDVTLAKFDLALFMQEMAEGTIRGGVVYSTNLFQQQTITTLTDRFSVLLRDLVLHPEIPIEMLQFYTHAEKTRRVGQPGSSRLKLKAARGKAVDLT